MAQNKDFKRLVRQRMSETGERYTAARAALRGDRNQPQRPDDIERWLKLMELPGVPGTENEGFEALQALPEPLLKDAALRGLRHVHWRVRRRCAQLLDDLTLTDESIAGLTNCLGDEHPGVRQAALHSLVCVGCKPDGCVIDIRSAASAMLHDPNAEVRRQAVGAFHSHHDPSASLDDDETLEMLRTVASTDGSARVRAMANELLREKQRRRAGDAARRALPDDVRRRTERHPGKWVAIADGTIISAQVFRGRLRRDMKGTGHTDALVVWVAPG